MKLAICVLLAACSVGEIEDDYWNAEGSDDDAPLAGLTATKRVAIEHGETNHAERIEELPVGKSEGSAERRVVLRTAAPALAKGDTLIALAEAQVTTRCDAGQTAAGCDYNPTIRAQLRMGGKTIATDTQSCTKSEHHCMFVFDASSRIEIDRDCAKCDVELVMWAWDGHARSGDKVLVGGNDGNYLDNGKVEGDLARLAVVRERGITAADRVKRETTGGGSFDLNTQANPEIAYSHLLKAGDLEPGEQFVIEAHVVADAAARARFSTELYISHGDTKIAPGAIGEHNGINCIGRCVTRKVAAFRVTERIAGPVYVNVAVRSAVPGGGNTRVTVKRGDGFVRSMRYAASMF
jgi:hypothetical protein